MLSEPVKAQIHQAVSHVCMGSHFSAALRHRSTTSLSLLVPSHSPTEDHRWWARVPSLADTVQAQEDVCAHALEWHCSSE